MSASKRRLLMLLSPAKTLDLSATSVSLSSTPVFTAEADVLVKELKKLTKPKLKTLLGVSDNINKLNYDRYQTFEEQESKQAILSFDGPAFKGLSMNSMNAEQMTFAQKHLRVLCGLYGVLRPFDEVAVHCVADRYKLEYLPDQAVPP